MNKAQILKEIQEYKNFKTRSDFAKFLGITPQNMSQWYNRATYDSAILVKKIPELSPRWLITGEGEMIEKVLKNDENLNTAQGDMLKNDENLNITQSDNELIKHFASQIGELNKRIGQLETENKHLQDENNKLKAEVESLKTIHIDFDPQPSNTTTLIEPA